MSREVRKLQAEASRHPTDPVTWFRLGRALVTAQEHDKARIALTEAIRQAQEGENDARLCAAVGDMLASMTFATDAAIAYERALSLRHSDPTIVLRCAEQLIVGGQHQRARTLLRQARTKGHEMVRWRLLADACEEAGDLEEALEVIDSMVANNPASLDLLKRHAVLSGRLGRHESAARSWRKIIAFSEDADVDALMSLGIALSDLEEHGEALVILSEVVQRAPDRADARANLGTVHLAMGDPRGAMQHLNKAVKLDPTAGQAQCMLGTALYHLGLLSQAAERFLIATEASPDWHVPRYNYGVALADLGRTQEAQSVIREALSLAPHDREIQDALSYLGSVPPDRAQK